MNLLNIRLPQIAWILESDSTVCIFVLQLLCFHKQETSNNDQRYDCQQSRENTAHNASVTCRMRRGYLVIESEAKRLGQNACTCMGNLQTFRYFPALFNRKENYRNDCRP